MSTLTSYTAFLACARNTITFARMLLAKAQVTYEACKDEPPTKYGKLKTRECQDGFESLGENHKELKNSFTLISTEHLREEADIEIAGKLMEELDFIVNKLEVTITNLASLNGPKADSVSLAS